MTGDGWGGGVSMAGGRGEGLSRRTILKGAVALAAGAVVGFDPVARRWVGAQEVATCTFDGVPQLDGELLFDDAARVEASTDKGNYVTRRPCAVLRPGSVADIAAMVAYCRKRRINVSARGQAHSTYGQSLTDGLVIDNKALSTIHEIGADHAVVDTGCTWKALVEAAYGQRKLTPPVLTGYTQLTIGGTLSMGGIGGLVGGQRTGLQVDHVRALEVVTGKGDVLSCSPSRHRDLFEAVLGGVGQYGVMTKATVDLVPARDRARSYAFHYGPNQLTRLFADFRLLLERPAFDHVYIVWMPPGQPYVAQLNAVLFYDVGLTTLPNDAALGAGLQGVPAIVDTTYLDYVFQIDIAVDVLDATVQWSRLAKPWFDVWLTEAAIEDYVKEVVPTLSADDIGVGGFLLTFATRRDLATRPNVVLPEPDGSKWVFLFDILTTSNTPDPGQQWMDAMLTRNDRLFARARDTYGGVRYPIGTVTFTAEDWRAHYGPRWPAVLASKAKYDPAGILGTGAGVFT